MASIWYSTNEINAKFDGGSFRCPSCGEYTRCAITGYGIKTAVWSVLSFGGITWRRVCCSCGQGVKISKKDAKEAAIKNNAWPEYVSAVRNKGLKYLGIFLAAMGVLFLGMMLISELSPVHDAAKEAINDLGGSAKVQFAEVYPADSYAYETDENDDIVSHSFACYYYDENDALSLCSIRVETDDEAYDELLAFSEDEEALIGDLILPVYGVKNEFDPELITYFREYADYAAEYIDAEVRVVDINYVSPVYEKTTAGEYLIAAPFLLAGLALIAIYSLAYNPARPPKSKEKALGEL